MRTGYGLVVGVLAAALAGSGCCKLCDWCRGPSDSRKVNEGPAAIREQVLEPGPAQMGPRIVVDQSNGGVPVSQGAAGARPAVRSGATGQTGAYGGTGN